MSSVKRIRANSYLLAQEYIVQMFKSAELGVSVTPYVLEGDGTPGKEHIEFEMRITKIGNSRISASRTPAKKVCRWTQG